MRILCRFHGWLIFARVIALFMFVWPYVRSHILCTQLVICLLLDFIHIWYLSWPWFEHVHIIQISRMVDVCESCSPFHVCLIICPFAHLVFATSLVALYSYLVSWLAMIWACAYYTGFMDGWFLWELQSFHVCLTIHFVCPSAHLVYATNYLSIVAFYSYLVSWLAMIRACAYYTHFTDGWFLQES
jgi:hypothetical protein